MTIRIVIEDSRTTYQAKWREAMAAIDGALRIAVEPFIDDNALNPADDSSYQQDIRFSTNNIALMSDRNMFRVEQWGAELIQQDRHPWFIQVSARQTIAFPTATTQDIALVSISLLENIPNDDPVGIARRFSDNMVLTINQPQDQMQFDIDSAISKLLLQADLDEL